MTDIVVNVLILNLMLLGKKWKCLMLNKNLVDKWIKLILETIETLLDSIDTSTTEYERYMYSSMIKIEYKQYDILIKHTSTRFYKED